MCLNLDNPEKRIAEKEIKVLKVLGRDKNNKLISPIYRTEVWDVSTEKLTELNVIIDKFEYPREAYRTTSGYYSFSNILDPNKCKENIGGTSSLGLKKLEVWEAIIPIGSEYVRRNNVICSNRIKLVSKVC